MPKLSMQEVRDVLTPFHPKIRSVVELAWAEQRKVTAFRIAEGLGSVLYSRTIANDVFDAIARIGMKEFLGDSSVTVVPEAQTFKLFFKGTVCGRFKRGDENNLGQNIPTQAALAFEDADGLLPGFPPETAKVEFTWSLNDLNTQLESVFVVARDGAKVLWQYEIEGAAGKGAVIPFPQPSGDGPSQPVVKPKKTPGAKPRRKE